MNNFFKKRKVNITRQEIKAGSERLSLRSLQVLEAKEMIKVEGGKSVGFSWSDMSYGSFCCNTLPQ